MAGPFSWSQDEAFKSDRLKGLKVVIVFGDQDRGETASANRLAVGCFEDAGADVKLIVLKGIGHSFPPDPDPLLRECLDFVWPAAASQPASP
jgi:hypothetical protein